jgi:hypothetical protein
MNMTPFSSLLAKFAAGLAVTLIAVLVVRQASTPDTMIDNLGRLAQFAMVGTLVGSSVLYSYRGQGTVALRNLLIWLAIIGVVALAYQYRGSLGL